MTSKDALREAQLSIAFRAPSGLPEHAPPGRSMPNEGTNVTTFFGEAVLAQIQLSEEKLEALALLRRIPLSALETSAANGVDAALFNMQRQLKAAQQPYTLIKAAALSETELAMLHRIAIAEQRAIALVRPFHQFCQSLRTRFASMPQRDRAEIASTVELCVALEQRMPQEQFAALASRMFYSTPSEAALAELMDTLRLVEPSLDAQATPELALQLAENTAEAKRRFIARTFGAEAGMHPEHILATQLHLDSRYAGETLVRDADLLRYLLSQPRQRSGSDADFLNLAYTYVTEYTARTVSVTPAEVVLVRLASQMVSRMSNYLMLCTLAASHLAHFAYATIDPALGACCTQWRNMTRLGELVGASHDHIQFRFARLMEHLFPGIGDEQFGHATVHAALQHARDYFTQHPTRRAWAYENTQEPWLSAEPRHQLRTEGTLGMMKADQPLIAMHNSDLWLHLKWAGLSVENIAHIADMADAQPSSDAQSLPGFAAGLLAESVREPELHSKALMALLALSSEPKPLFFGTEDVQTLLEEVPLPPPPQIELPAETEYVEDWPSWD